MSGRSRTWLESERWELADRAAEAQAESRHGLAELSMATGIPSATLRRWARVARRFPPEARRSRLLSFSHHEVVAGREDRLSLLELAAEEGWSATRLREEVKSRNEVSGSSPKEYDSSSRDPSALDAALDYVRQLSSLSTVLRSGLRCGVREKVHALAAAATALDGRWDS
jgi:hypothetical protein